jgi:hypothetical protein
MEDMGFDAGQMNSFAENGISVTNNWTLFNQSKKSEKILKSVGH